MYSTCSSLWDAIPEPGMPNIIANGNTPVFISVDYLDEHRTLFIQICSRRNYTRPHAKILD